MSYASLPAEIRAIAERRCEGGCAPNCGKHLSSKQFDVFRLWCAGAGAARIAIMLDVAEPTARRHLKRAQQKIKIEMERPREAA